MDKSGKQTIRCDVEECKHHDDNDLCELNSIAVSSVAAHPHVECADDSMCASFETTQG